MVDGENWTFPLLFSPPSGYGGERERRGDNRRVFASYGHTLSSLRSSSPSSPFYGEPIPSLLSRRVTGSRRGEKEEEEKVFRSFQKRGGGGGGNVVDKNLPLSPTWFPFSPFPL